MSSVEEDIPERSRFTNNIELIDMHVCDSSRKTTGLGTMYVIKRNGRKEEVQFDKITARIKKLVRQKATNLFLHTHTHKTDLWIAHLSFVT